MKEYHAWSTAAVFLGMGALNAATPVWFDGFDVTTSANNINNEIGSPRQGGFPVPTTWVANTVDNSNDYHHQTFAGGNTPLLLAADANLTNIQASPNHNFIGTANGGEIIGKRIDVFMDTAVTAGAGIGAYNQAAITVGATTPLSQGSGVNTYQDGLSVVFVEDEFGGGGNFVQVWFNGTPIGNNIPNPVDNFGATISILSEDLADGNPFDGVGNVEVDIQIFGSSIGTFNVGNGFTSNFITLGGQWAAGANNLATHTFDNLTVYSAPVPEPSVTLIGAMGALSILRRRRD